MPKKTAEKAEVKKFGFNNITGRLKVFKRENESVFITLNAKVQDKEEYKPFYITCYFAKDTLEEDIEHGDIIIIKESWLKPKIDKKGNVYLTLFVNKFEFEE